MKIKNHDLLHAWTHFLNKCLKSDESPALNGDMAWEVVIYWGKPLTHTHPNPHIVSYLEN